jgi:hypothetical protein
MIAAPTSKTEDLADCADLVHLIATFTFQGDVEDASSAEDQLRERLNQLIDARIKAHLERPVLMPPRTDT